MSLIRKEIRCINGPKNSNIPDRQKHQPTLLQAVALKVVVTPSRETSFPPPPRPATKKPVRTRSEFPHKPILKCSKESYRHSQPTSPTMPSEVSDIKQFIEICRRKDAKCRSISSYITFSISESCWKLAWHAAEQQRAIIVCRNRNGKLHMRT